MEIAENLQSIKEALPSDVELIAVSKTHPIGTIMRAYDAGHRAFGENKVQELIAKAPAMPQDIEWHLIGHLQTNKVKYIVDFVYLVHSVDSLKLLKEINKRAAGKGKCIDCLLQVHIADETSKFGLNEDEVRLLLNSVDFSSMKNIRVRGLMGMATFTEDKSQVRNEFTELKAVFESLKEDVASTSNWQPEVVSMGMSGDYQIAIDAGSNMVRVGSAIFGARNYNAD